MSDPLSDTFRANVLRIAARRRLNLHRLGLLVYPGQPSQARYQLVGRTESGLTLRTVHRYATALEVPAAELLHENQSGHIDTRAGRT